MKATTKTAIGKALKIIIVLILGWISWLFVPWHWVSSVSKYVRFPAVASLGGVIVLVGLVWERSGRKSDDESKLGRGEWAVMLGIVVEILTAGTFATMEQIKDIRTNPLNQPISTVSVDLQFAVEGSDFSKDPSTPPLAHLMLMESDMQPVLKEGPMILVAEKVSAERLINVSGIREYSFAFRSDPARVSSPSFFNGKTVSEVINNVNALEIFPSCIPTNSQILTGQAELYVNGIHKHFAIDMQKMRWVDEKETNGFELADFCLTAKAPPHK